MSNQVPNLPRDVMFDILSRVPIKSLLQFRSVAKSWPFLIAHPHFINLHLSRATTTHSPHLLLYYESHDYTKHSYTLRSTDTFNRHMPLHFPFNSVHGYIRIVGSANGLVCLFDTNYFNYIGKIIVWNPVVRKSKFVPNSHDFHRFRDTFSHMVVGFAFSEKGSDYKVVQILYDSDSSAIPDVLVYDLEGNIWRKIGAVAPCYIPNCWNDNVCVNGIVHWMAYRRPKEDGVFNSIMAFDLSDEVFREVGLPRNLSLNYNQVHLVVWEESLALIVHFRGGVGDWWEIWLMKEYGVAESWTKQFAIEQVQISFPLCFISNGELLLVLINGKLVSYDPQNQGVKDLDICGLPGSFRVVSYMKSLVLLDGGNEVFD